MSEVANPSTIAALTEIWQRVLQRSDFSINDNFFDLGGDPTSAKQLFIEISQKLGHEHPTATICYAPTIASLAGMLQQQPRGPLAPLIKLNAASTGQSVFLAQGIGSSMEDFVLFARHLALEQPIYGLQTRGLDGLEEPLNRVEDMAKHFLDTIKAIQPRGPYYLLGYSFGGVIAFEMARQLEIRGESIALLSLIETYPHKRFLSATQRVRVEFHRVRRRAIKFLPQMRRSAPQVSPAVASTLAEVAERVRQNGFDALQNYRPQFFTGRVRFVQAAIPSFFADDPKAFWANHAQHVDVETVPGDHVGMITTHVRELAKVVSRHIRDAADASR
jgi:acetoacetyl-CoA synthetase